MSLAAEESFLLPQNCACSFSRPTLVFCPPACCSCRTCHFNSVTAEAHTLLSNWSRAAVPPRWSEHSYRLGFRVSPRFPNGAETVSPPFTSSAIHSFTQCVVLGAQEAPAKLRVLTVEPWARQKRSPRPRSSHGDRVANRM